MRSNDRFDRRRLLQLGFLLLSIVAFFIFPANAQAAAPDCSAGTAVTVVAHLDDDLLFVEPAISERLHAGWCVTVVHLIGGANGASFDYVQKREEGTRLAYARLAGVVNDWDESTIRIAGEPVFELRLKQQPRVRLLELRLPGGAVRGGRVPLGLLWDQGATLTTYPMGHGEIAPGRYTRDSLSATLRSILEGATRIYTLNPDTVPFIEHPDHIYAARITRHVAQSLAHAVPISYFVTYPTGNWPVNLSGEDAQRKRDVAATYFSVDGGDVAQVFGEYEWNGDWVQRQYAHDDSTAHVRPDFVGTPSVLFNAASSRCLASAGNGREPVLAPCNGSMQQQWTWEPRTTYPGNEHDAALVSAATGQCVAEHDGTLAEARCEQWEPSQRWTPWDFGLIFTPSRRCLGEEDGRLNLRGCASLTTRYRWSALRPAWPTDLRLTGAMYEDVTGQGAPSAVYVQRRADGPGFDVYVQKLQAGERPARWYANAVPFDSRAITATCGEDTLCFDSARFVLGDFDGDGRADLMVITPRLGGTAFWLLRSTGRDFEAPALWFQSDQRIPTGRTQQYIAFSNNAQMRRRILLAMQKSDKGAELWAVGDDGTGHIQQARVLEDDRFRFDLRLLAVRAQGTDSASFLAVQPASEGARIAVIPFGFSNGHWHAGNTSLLPPVFQPATTKFSTDHHPGDANNAIVMTVPRFSEPGGVDVWESSDIEAAPVLLVSLPDEPWQDSSPALLHSGSHTTLAFYRRTDAILDNTHFSGGQATLLQYDIDRREGNDRPEAQLQLPAIYSETLWLERLSQ
ncbi:PIG-L family deacetylase [Paraburkholderia phytofirmans]|uniref:PIG-L family deacetylase n=1 Tax=Paraburkholderia sp. BL6665CI2N2 TaxID=1938806 RepID=UPI001065C4FD|nr:PIG-L family deacetylase [Paraburkholderia sp. BL6665CI2N2]TDY23125.1 GlcNAc-PI de-N-acetylase [Paraburkholderia sp. BL6665CI2N2]